MKTLRQICEERGADHERARARVVEAEAALHDAQGSERRALKRLLDAEIEFDAETRREKAREMTATEAAALSPAPSEEAGKGEDDPNVPFELLSEDALRHATKIPGGIHEATGVAPDLPGDTRVDVLYHGGWGMPNQKVGEVRWSDRSISHWHLSAYEDTPTVTTDNTAPVITSDSVGLDAFQEPETRAGEPDWQNNPNVEIVSGEPWPMPSAYETTLTITTDNTAALPPLLPPEPPQAATPEQLIEAGAINGEAYGLWRKMAKEPA